MENLVDVSLITVMLRPRPLLEKKVIVDTMVASEVRFNTPRRTSGALPPSDGMTSALARQVSEWAKQVRIPSFSVEGFGKAIDLPPLNPDSLRTVQQARAIVQRTDSSRHVWEANARGLNPGPKIDSAKALIERLRTLDTRTLGIDGVRQTVQTSQATLKGLTSTLEQVRTLQRTVDSGVARIRAGVAGLDERAAATTARRGLLKLRHLTRPTSPALFGRRRSSDGRRAYGCRWSDQYMPAGLKPRARRRKRLRMAGTTVAPARGPPQPPLRYASARRRWRARGRGDYAARLKDSPPSPRSTDTHPFSWRSGARGAPAHRRPDGGAG